MVCEPVDDIKQHDYEKAVRFAGFRVAVYLGELARELTPDETKVYETYGVMEGKEKFPFTSGKNKYDFITVQELAKQIVAASVQDQITGIINVCTGEPISLADKVESFIKENDFKIKLEYGAYPDRPYDSDAIWGDATKIRKILENEK